MARTIASAKGRSVFRVDVPSEKLALYEDSESSDDPTPFSRSTPEVTPESTPDAAPESDPDFEDC